MLGQLVVSAPLSLSLCPETRAPLTVLHQSRASVSLTRPPTAQSPSTIPTPPKWSPALKLSHHIYTRPNAQVHTHAPSFHQVLGRSRIQTSLNCPLTYPPTPGIRDGAAVGGSCSTPPGSNIAKTGGPRPGTGTWVPGGQQWLARS